MPVSYKGELKVLQYIGNMNNSTASDTFANVIKI